MQQDHAKGDISSKMDRIRNDKAGKIAALNCEIAKHKSKVALFLENFEGNSRLVNEKIYELEGLIDSLEREKERLQLMNESSQKITPAMIAKELDELEGLDNKPRIEQQRIIQKYIKKVEVNDDSDNFFVDIHSALDRFCVPHDGSAN